MPCAANVEGDREQEPGRTEVRRGREKGSTRGREAGAETEKALVCYFLELIIQAKNLYSAKFFLV